MSNRAVHPSQERTLNQILNLVDAKGNIIGPVAKLDAHTNSFNRKTNLPHQAFSIFLFDSKDRLLMQCRSPSKLLFPGRWSNTCCSHFLFKKGSRGERISQRVKDELGLTISSDGLVVVDQILYRAEQDVYGQFQYDYLYFGKIDEAKATLDLNPDEVSEVHWLQRKEVSAFRERLRAQGKDYSPWFNLIVERGLLDSRWEEFAKGRRDFKPITLKSFL